LRVRYPIKERWEAFLATRPRGARVREDIERELAKVSPGGFLALDFSGVDAVTFSFADEAIAKLVADRLSGDLPDRGLVLEGLNEDVRETVEVVLQRRKLAAVVATESGFSAVGVGDWLEPTLRTAAKLGEFSARALGDELGLSPQAANNRLQLLVASGAVVRHRVVPDKGGKEFMYRFIVPQLV
jgi:STAS-like domain of unknown function (DUF4325)